MNILGKWSNSSQSPYFIETSTKDDVLSLSHIMNELSAWLNYYHYKCPFYAPCFQWDSIQAKWKNNCYSKQLCWFMDVVRSLLSTLPHMGRAYWAFDDIQVGERSYCRCIIYISDLYPKAKVAQVDLNNFELYFSHWMKKIKCVAYEHSLW